MRRQNYLYIELQTLLNLPHLPEPLKKELKAIFSETPLSYDQVYNALFQKGSNKLHWEMTERVGVEIKPDGIEIYTIKDIPKILVLKENLRGTESRELGAIARGEEREVYFLKVLKLILKSLIYVESKAS